MHIAILTFEGYNELDSLIALGVLNRVKRPGWRVSIASPTAKVRSMNGVVLEAQASLQDAVGADAVIVGSAKAESALHYVAPVGEKEDYVARAMRNIQP